MKALAHFTQRLFLLATITVALAAAGFGHRFPSADDIALQAYMMAGGDLSDLCQDGNGDGLPDHGDCPACHLVGPADMPDTGGKVLDANLAFVAKVVAPRESRALRTVLDPARGMRAPPLA